MSAKNIGAVPYFVGLPNSFGMFPSWESAWLCIASTIWRMLLVLDARWAAIRTRATAGRSRPIRIAMMLRATSSSSKLSATRCFICPPMPRPGERGQLGAG